MIEKQCIKGTDVWIKVDAHPVERDNPHVFPTEYFTASCYMQDPLSAAGNGEHMKNEDGETKFFESPVAALTAARKHLENNL